MNSPTSITITVYQSAYDSEETCSAFAASLERVVGDDYPEAELNVTTNFRTIGCYTIIVEVDEDDDGNMSADDFEMDIHETAGKLWESGDF